jgi:RNA polymerase sigma-70 factor (ECF subfamily)
MDEATFQAFYQRTAPSLWGYLRRVLGCASLADDLLQESFCRLLKSPPPTSEEGALKAYTFQIASHLVVDHWRRTRRERRSFLEREPSAPQAPAELEQHVDLARIFEELKPQERALLWLAYVEGSEHREIAGALGLGEKSIRVLLFRARQKLARILEQRGFRGEVRK